MCSAARRCSRHDLHRRRSHPIPESPADGSNRSPTRTDRIPEGNRVNRHHPWPRRRGVSPAPATSQHPQRQPRHDETSSHPILGPKQIHPTLTDNLCQTNPLAATATRRRRRPGLPAAPGELGVLSRAQTVGHLEAPSILRSACREPTGAEGRSTQPERLKTIAATATKASHASDCRRRPRLDSSHSLGPLLFRTGWPIGNFVDG
jgi:hypothetical protein